MSSIELPAVCKIFSHAVKYPHLSVFGVLVGTNQDTVEDVVPLFHGPFLSGMFETAMKLIEVHNSKSGYTVLGCYFAGELLDSSLSSFITSVADKIMSLYPQSIILQVDNRQMDPLACNNFLIQFSHSPKTGWAQTNSNVSLPSETSKTLQNYQTERTWESLIDFDSHLLDPTRNWLT